MCRNIRQLRGETPASDEEIRDAALQFVRKVTGYRTPSRANQEAFDRAVEEVAAATQRVLSQIAPATPRTPPSPPQL